MAHRMIVVGNVRYRIEDAPEPAEVQAGGGPERPEAASDVQNKARRPAPRAKGGRRGTAT